MRTAETKLVVRMPAEAKSWLAARAGANCRSMNGEILAILKAHHEADERHAAQRQTNTGDTK